MNDSFARSPVSRYNSILMSGADGYTQTVMSTQIARIRAYDNLHKAGKPITVETLQQAEKEVMSTMFDKNGKLTDWAANHATKEAALNLDNEFADWLTATTDRIPMLRHLLMFPRTGVNFLAKAGSYIGLSAIPGATKYGKVLYARTDKQIAEALAAHGLTDMSKDPNAMAIFKHLKRVYAGRLAFTGMLVGGLYSYAMMGNLVVLELSTPTNVNYNVTALTKAHKKSKLVMFGSATKVSILLNLFWIYLVIMHTMHVT